MIEAMKQMIDALQMPCDYWNKTQFIKVKDAIEVGRQAIAEAEKQQNIFKQLSSQSMLQLWQNYCDVKVERDELKDKLAEAKNQEPVGWIDSKGNMICSKINESCKPLYTHPPKREPLTDEEIATISVECATVSPSDIYFARAIEAAHGIKEKNT